MTRRHKKAAALADAMRAEDEAERQRLQIDRDTAIQKRDALNAARDDMIARINESAAELVASQRRQYAELTADEDRRIAEIERQLRELEGDEEPGIGHNSDRAAA